MWPLEAGLIGLMRSKAQVRNDHGVDTLWCSSTEALIRLPLA